MSGDLFKRFAAAPTPAAPAGPDGSSRLRPIGAVGSRVSEAEVLAAVDRVPALPTVVARILAITGDRLSNAADLENLIGQDMVIAGKVLKLVNSPFYGLAHPVSSLAQAVALVGFASLRSLVLAASTGGVLTVRLGVYGFSERGLWLNAMATAFLARQLARTAHQPPEIADEHFVAGLLRDVGFLVLGPLLERERLSLGLADRGADLISRERSLIGFDHCWVGERIAEKWNLPERLRFVIGRHHRIPSDAATVDLRLLAAVRLAERLAWNSQLGLNADHPFDGAIDPVLIAAAGLDGEGFRTVAAAVPGIVKQVASGEF